MDELFKLKQICETFRNNNYTVSHESLDLAFFLLEVLKLDYWDIISEYLKVNFKTPIDFWFIDSILNMFSLFEVNKNKKETFNIINSWVLYSINNSLDFSQCFNSQLSIIFSKTYFYDGPFNYYLFRLLLVYYPSPYYSLQYIYHYTKLDKYYDLVVEEFKNREEEININEKDFINSISYNEFFFNIESILFLMKQGINLSIILGKIIHFSGLNFSYPPLPNHILEWIKILIWNGAVVQIKNDTWTYELYALMHHDIFKKTIHDCISPHLHEKFLLNNIYEFIFYVN